MASPQEVEINFACVKFLGISQSSVNACVRIGLRETISPTHGMPHALTRAERRR